MTEPSIAHNSIAMGGVYAIICTPTDRAYVGSSIDVERRLRQHINMLNRGGHSNTHLQRAWNKYGANCFCFKVVETIDDHAALLDREKWWINRLNSVEHGFNQKRDPNSSLGVKWSDEAKQRHSTTMQGKGHPHTPESRRRISEALHERIFSPEHRRKLSEAGKKKTISEEAKQKISVAFKGKKIGPMSEETKRKLSEAKRGRKLSDEHKQKIAESAKRNGATPYLTNAKLRSEDVAIIKSLLANGAMGADLARRYGVRPQVISDIKCNRKWSHVSPAHE